jgi:hypothetical protein
MNDYRQAGDPYGISEMTAESAHEGYSTIRNESPCLDVRGNTKLVPRSVPTQAEADAALGR